MGVRIDKVRIANFRGIENVEIDLPRIAVLIGANNSGKTSVIKAIQLALGDYSRFLTEDDFHIKADDTPSENILIDLRIIPTDEEGTRANEFEEIWIEEFSDNIQSEANSQQFVAMRTSCKRDKMAGGFSTVRHILDEWSDFNEWRGNDSTKKINKSKVFNGIPFIPIEAQRDISQELREKHSFVGKVLSGVEYSPEDVLVLEEQINAINEQAIDKSNALCELKRHLDGLNNSFSGKGKAEVTPFPKKMRDLSRRFTVHFGEAGRSFSMEYHGMGTRSWASMLTAKAFTELAYETYKLEEKPFSPILAAEEPEAHLHPNAQRIIYKQLEETKGQVLVSTHSPYLASLAAIEDLRLLSNKNEGVKSCALSTHLEKDDIKTLQREVLRLRGEILFSRAIILFEGVTEEQVVPILFEKHFGAPPFAKGVNCISVNGTNYAPFIKIACCYEIPVCIISDSENQIKTDVQRAIEKIKDSEFNLENHKFSIHFLGEDNDFEAELIGINLRDEIIEALALSRKKKEDSEQRIEATCRELREQDNEKLLRTIRNCKTCYSAWLAEVIQRNPNKKEANQLIPPAIQDAFEKLTKWGVV